MHSGPRKALPWILAWVVLASLGATPKRTRAKLWMLYRQDQDQRQDFASKSPAQLKALLLADQKRRRQVEGMLARGEIQHPQDLFYAAMIFQHGSEAEDSLRAHVLATSAAFEGIEEARWLAAAALDRYLVRIQKTQLFGTQFFKGPKDSLWGTHPQVFKPSDSVRESFRVPPESSQREQLETLNRALERSGP